MSSYPDYRRRHNQARRSGTPAGIAGPATPQRRRYPVPAVPPPPQREPPARRKRRTSTRVLRWALGMGVCGLFLFLVGSIASDGRTNAVVWIGYLLCSLSISAFWGWVGTRIWEALSGLCPREEPKD